LPDDVFVKLRDNFARRHVVKRGEKLLFFWGRGAVAAGRENYFFVGLAGHEMSNPFICNPVVRDPFVCDPFVCDRFESNALDARKRLGVLSRDP
jgi:hypothetical protein